MTALYDIRVARSLLHEAVSVGGGGPVKVALARLDSAIAAIEGPALAPTDATDPADLPPLHPSDKTLLTQVRLYLFQNCLRRSSGPLTLLFDVEWRLMHADGVREPATTDPNDADPGVTP